MKVSRYEKYIVRKPELPAHAGPREGIRSEDWINSGSFVLCDKKLFNEAGSIIEYGMVRGERPTRDETFTGPGAHKHDYAEMFAFLGTNPDDVYDLGAVVEMWLGEGDDRELMVITTTSSLFIPAGLTHEMKGSRNVRRPYLYLTVMFDATDYVFNSPSDGK